MRNATPSTQDAITPQSLERIPRVGIQERALFLINSRELAVTTTSPPSHRGRRLAVVPMTIQPARLLTSPHETKEIRVGGFDMLRNYPTVPGNKRADKLAGVAAEKQDLYTAMSLAYLKLKISEKFRKAKDN